MAVTYACRGDEDSDLIWSRRGCCSVTAAGSGKMCGGALTTGGQRKDRDEEVGEQPILCRGTKETGLLIKSMWFRE